MHPPKNRWDPVIGDGLYLERLACPVGPLATLRPLEPAVLSSPERVELKRVESERHIFKKAIPIFAQSQP